MVCKVCGRSTENENANFCEYCGSSYKDTSIVNTQMVENQKEKTQYNQQQGERASQQQQYGQQQYNQQQYGQQPYNGRYASSSGLKEKEEPITFRNWLATLILPFIPFVGWIVNLVMLIVWGFGRGTCESKKNWARAALIVHIVSIVLAIIFIATVFGSVFSELSSGGFNANDYLNNFY